MAGLDLIAFPAAAGRLERHPLNLDGGACWVELRNLPGASHLHILLERDGEPVLRAEIPAQGGETLRVEIRLDVAGPPGLNCPGRIPSFLPLKPALPPAASPLFITGQEDCLDVALVVDATTRFFFRHPESGLWASSALLADAGRWQAHADKLCGFVETLGRHYPQCRIGLLAFGDQPTPNVTAPELQPAYWLYPAEDSAGLLRPWDRERLKRGLADIEASSGGDFVDALADALAVCVGLRWNPKARKLVLVSGDSPGASLLWPVRQGGDACVREHDVDTQTLRLHRLGVEILTVYHDPDRGFLEDLIGPPKAFQRHAQDQYQRLASLPEMAFPESQFQGKPEAEVWLKQTGFIGHGGCYGEWLGVGSDLGGV